MGDKPDIYDMLDKAISAAYADCHDPAEDVLTDPLVRQMATACGEAVAEIDRLRAALGDCRESVRLEVIENERLRAELAAAVTEYIPNGLALQLIGKASLYSQAQQAWIIDYRVIAAEPNPKIRDLARAALAKEGT